MASIFSVQNLQTFLRRKNLRPPGPPPGPPGPPCGRGPRGPPGPECPLRGVKVRGAGVEAGASAAGAAVCGVLVSSAIFVSSQYRSALSDCAGNPEMLCVVRCSFYVERATVNG